MTARTRAWLVAGLLAAAAADLLWIAWPWIAFWYATGTGSGGIGSVSAGISAGLIVSILLPVPLLLHGLAQVCARHAGADVHRWWRRHLLAWVACVPFAAVMFMRGAPAALVATMFFVGAPLLALVFVGQHVVVALVVLSGLHALAQPTADTEPPVC